MTRCNSLAQPASGAWNDVSNEVSVDPFIPSCDFVQSKRLNQVP